MKKTNPSLDRSRRLATLIVFSVGLASGIARAQTSPEPSRDLVVVEASVEGGVFVAGQPPASMRLCVTETNAFSNPAKGFVADDRFLFRVPTGCGSLSEQTPGNPGADLTIDSTPANPILASDLTWSVTSSAVNFRYVGSDKAFRYEDNICVVVKFTATSARGCALEYRFTPRGTKLGSNATNGTNRIFSSQLPSFFPLETIQPMAGPPGPPGPPGPEGPPGTPGEEAAWELEGNAGTSPGTNFLGTTDNVAFQIHVNGQRAFRLEPNATSPNILGAFSGNTVFPTVVGATIGGGGQPSLANLVLDNFGTVGGGAGNQAGTDDAQPASAAHAAVGGGLQNMAAGAQATVGGGFLNKALANFGTVAGGQENTAGGLHATVGGGFSNETGANFASVLGGNNNSASAIRATVAGGNENAASADSATVGGGSQNNVAGLGGTIAGGRSNIVSAEVGTVGGGYDNKSALNATVSGGFSNTASGYRSTISGGFQNIASGQESNVGGGASNNASGLYATISGGAGNIANDVRATIGGGQENTAFFSSSVGGGFSNDATGEFAAIAGGLGNAASGQSTTVAGGRANSATGHFSTVGGGLDNVSGPDSYTTVAGGHLNVARYGTSTVGGGELNQGADLWATIAGGYTNFAEGRASFIGGGQFNRTFGINAVVSGGESNTARYGWSMVPGGLGNAAEGNYSLAAGRRAKAIDHGDFVWADSTDEDFTSTRANQFLVRARGGVGIGMNDPDAQLHVTESVDLIAEDPGSHVAIIENASATDVNGPDVLALRVQQTNPTPATNYVSFFGAATRVGSIEGDGAGGVTYKSGSADFAEWLPRADTGEAIEAGDVIGVFGGRVSRATRNADQVMVVSSRPIVLGNSPPAEGEHLHERIALLGQVPVRVLGAIRAGEYIVASGKEDGTGIAVAPEKLTLDLLWQVVGRAWESSDDPGLKLVRIVVGLPAGSSLSHLLLQRIQDQNRLIERQGIAINALTERVKSIERLGNQE